MAVNKNPQKVSKCNFWEENVKIKSNDKYVCVENRNFQRFVEYDLEINLFDASWFLSKKIEIAILYISSSTGI